MADPDLTATIKVDGTTYTNWTDVRVTRVYAAAFSDFAFGCAEPGNPGSSYSTLRIRPGQRCQVTLAGVQVIDGYVTDRQVGYDGNVHQVLIQGRSLTREIARSTAEPGQYRGYSFQAIAERLCKDRGVKVIVKDPPPGWDRPIPNYRTNMFATVWSNLERLARKRGVQMYDDAQGNLVLSGAPVKGQPVADLVEGENILAWRGVMSDQNVFSKIIAVGQNAGSDQAFGKKAAEVQATSTNPLAAPNSVLRVEGEHNMSPDDAKTRTDAQAGTSSATDIECTVTVHGWLRPDGQLWGVRDPLTVKSPMMFPDGDGSMKLAVRSTDFIQGPQGSVTVLNLCLPNALSIVSTDVPTGQVPSLLNSSGKPATPDVPT